MDEISNEMRDCTPWKQTSEFPFCMILAGDTLYLGGENKIGAVKASNGELLWTQPVNGDVYGMSAASGSLVVSTHLGSVHCFRSETPSLNLKDLTPSNLPDSE
jgi:outer membrane protein assembly factor BamB